MSIAINYNRIKKIPIGDIEILEVDYSCTSESEFLNVLEAQLEFAQSRPERVCFFLLNVYKAPTSMKIIESCKKAVLRSQDLFSVTVLYNANALTRVMLKLMNIIKTKKIIVFNKREEALQFLQEAAINQPNYLVQKST